MSWKRDAGALAAAMVAIFGVVVIYRQLLHVADGVIVALTFLFIILLVAASARFWVAATSAVVAMFAFNFFFLPPVGTFYLENPENWVALFVFLTVGLVASNLSAAARARAEEAIERAEFVEARKAAEVARRSEELKSALLASIGHDLRTPLTAIRVAASNLQASLLDANARREQSELILAEVERLQRLFQNILDMARIDAGAIAADMRWVHPSEIIEAARDQVGQALRRHPIDLQVRSDDLIQLDPRLTAASLAYVLENAAHYSSAESPISIGVGVSSDGLEITVRDHGPGIAPDDLPHLFERFYRGAESKRRPAGTGMGLSIARGMLAAERGRIWAENCSDGGARFTILVAAEQRRGDQRSDDRVIPIGELVNL
jgi:two-component system sensor histidine kinase KdpD